MLTGDRLQTCALFHIAKKFVFPLICVNLNTSQPFPLTLFNSHLLFSGCFYIFPGFSSTSHHITFKIFSLPLCNPLSFPSFSSARSTFLLSSAPLSSPLFVSPLFSSPVLSSPQPSVYPIWPSHLSWELSQGKRLLIQFLLNLMALGSAFAIPATCRETKQKKKTRRRQRSIKTCLKNLSPDDPLDD